MTPYSELDVDALTQDESIARKFAVNFEAGWRERSPIEFSWPAEAIPLFD